MLDNLDRNGRETPASPKGRDEELVRPLADREVPLTGNATRADIHAWLDGELSEAEVRRGDAVRDVDFWLRVDREVQVRREMKTPAHVLDRIMDALPMAAPEAALPWWKRPFTVTPTTAIVATAGALAIGAALGAAVIRSR